MQDLKPGLITGLLCLLGFIAIGLLADRIFEHVPHSEDEAAYLFQAQVFAQNRLTVPTPANADAFWSPFVLDHEGLRFGKYPPGWPLLLSLGVRIGQPWLVNALLGTATLALIGHLGRKMYGPLIGAGAAALGLVTPGFLFLSSSLLSHSASLFWLTLALVALVHLHQSKRLQAGLAAVIGLTLGAAFVTRPFAALSLALPIGLYVVVALFRHTIGWSSLLWLVTGGVIVSSILPLYWWAVGGSPGFNAYVLVWPYDRPGFGPDIGPQGYTLADAVFINARLKLITLANGLFGWPGWSSLLFLPIPFLTGRLNRWDGLLLGTLLSLIGLHLFYWAFGGADGGFPRYYYDGLPALLLLTVRGIDRTRQILERWASPLRHLPLAVVGLFVVYSLGWVWPSLLAEQKGKYGITPEPLDIVAAINPPKPALVVVSNVEDWSDFAAPFAANSPTLDGPIVYAIDWGPDFTRLLQAQFPDRTCWQLVGRDLAPCNRR